MSDDAKLERRMIAAAPAAPSELRERTLAVMRRELAAARWDRRLGRAAAAVLVVGVALNVGVAWRGDPRPVAGAEAGERMAGDSLVQAAVAIADATDAETGRRVARQLAALGGRELSDEQAAAIDAAVRKREG